MKRRWQLALITLFVAAGVVAWLSQKDTPLYASATAVRFPESLDLSKIELDDASNPNSARILVAYALT